MNYKRMLKKELARIEAPEINTVLTSFEGTSKKRNKTAKRLSAMPIAAIILSVAIISCTSLAIPAVTRYFNAKALGENNLRLKEVPEGYVGIYSTDDLNNTRYAPNLNYILMSDIVFDEKDFATGGAFEGGWTPIGSEVGGESFSGIFNGNGYVIKNLLVKDVSNCERASFGLFGETNGYFINVGLENCLIEPTPNEKKNFDGESLSVGTLAGNATFVGGCYANECSVNVTLDNFHLDNITPKICAGGIAGIADYLDSCISYTNLSIYGESEFPVYAGLCSGQSLSAVTSLSSGNISVDGASYTSVSKHDISVVTLSATIPTLLDKDAMNEIRAAFKEKFGEKSFYELEFLAFFHKVERNAENADSLLFDKYLEANRAFGFISLDEQEPPEYLYILSPGADSQRLENMANTLLEAFDGYENFSAFCSRMNIKCGLMNCYSFDSKGDIQADMLENFDFENIYTTEKGKVILAIFAGR